MLCHGRALVQLGVEIKMLDDSKGNKDCVVAVERVVSGGPCDKAGLKDEDVIDRWNGERIYSKAAWTDKVCDGKTATPSPLPPPREIQIFQKANRKKNTPPEARAPSRRGFGVLNYTDPPPPPPPPMAGRHFVSCGVRDGAQP